jgi:energy-coupling factor transport system ATP-binding protein
MRITYQNGQNDVLIDVQHVSYTHWNQTEPTLRDVSFQISRGSLNVLVGPSGSGKSTLCDLFNGVIPHLHGGKLEGEVRVAGLDTLQAEVKNLAQQVGRVFQDPEVMFSMLYVEDEIAFGPENLRMDRATIQEIVEQLLVQTELGAHRKNLVWNLSGGQIQKLGLACVLAMRPQMIVLDEPTSNLDPGATHNVHELILGLRDQGITVLLVTRELDEFLAEADQLLVLEAGKLLASGPPGRVLAEHGAYMVESLGVWLPETSEIGIELAEAGLLPRASVPIKVSEMIAALMEAGLLSRELPAGLESLSPERSPAGKEILVSAKDLTYRYPGGVQALKGISIEIEAGEWLMIVGRNGAGKSTLSRLLVGLNRPQDGALTLFGRDARRWEVPELANHIALVFQNPEHQFLTDTVGDELEYSLLAKGISDPAEMRERKDAMLRQLGLEAFTETHPLALSAGLKRRLGVATMLVGQPRLLLVDEPTYGQDRAMTHTLMALMQEIRDQGVSVVMITHDMRLVQEYAERVVVMSEGRILFDGASSRLFELEEVLQEANLRRTLLHDLMRAMSDQGAPVNLPVRQTADLVHLFSRHRIKEGRSV